MPISPVENILFGNKVGRFYVDSLALIDCSHFILIILIYLKREKEERFIIPAFSIIIIIFFYVFLSPGEIIKSGSLAQIEPERNRLVLSHFSVINSHRGAGG